MVINQPDTERAHCFSCLHHLSPPSWNWLILSCLSKCSSIQSPGGPSLYPRLGGDPSLGPLIPVLSVLSVQWLIFCPGDWLLWGRGSCNLHRQHSKHLYNYKVTRQGLRKVYIICLRSYSQSFSSYNKWIYFPFIKLKCADKNLPTPNNVKNLRTSRPFFISHAHKYVHKIYGILCDFFYINGIMQNLFLGNSHFYSTICLWDLPLRLM